MVSIRIKYLSDKIEKLRYIDGKSDWIDLRAAESVELKAGEFRLIPLGIAMELPKGYEAHIVPRSSTFKNFGVIQTNHCGIVDESYCGDNDQWFFPALLGKGGDALAGNIILQLRLPRKIIHMILISVLVVVHGDGLLGLTAGIVWIGSWRISINTTY